MLESIQDLNVPIAMIIVTAIVIIARVQQPILDLTPFEDLDQSIIFEKNQNTPLIMIIVITIARITFMSLSLGFKKIRYAYNTEIYQTI